ncbi:MAG: ROK family protein [Ktedonobacteraceae bacterium]
MLMSDDRGVALGLEIGGEQATIALVDRHGRIQQRATAKTLRGRPALATLEPYLRTIDGMLEAVQADGLHVGGIGVSIPGSVDPLTRRPAQVPLFPTLNGFPLCELLEKRYNIPASLHADVDAAILGEHLFGAGKEQERLLFFTINAVVGASFVADGQLEPARKQYTGHICHIPVSASGPRCSCGKYGCINTLISIDAMKRMVQRALRRGEETTLTRRFLNHELLSHQLLAEEAERGDSLAVRIYREVARWLCAAIMQYISLFKPTLFIVGGNVLDAGDLLFNQIPLVLEGKQFSTIANSVKIVPACLGRDAALIGSTVPLF